MVTTPAWPGSDEVVSEPHVPGVLRAWGKAKQTIRTGITACQIPMRRLGLPTYTPHLNAA